MSVFEMAVAGLVVFFLLVMLCSCLLLMSGEEFFGGVESAGSGTSLDFVEAGSGSAEERGDADAQLCEALVEEVFEALEKMGGDEKEARFLRSRCSEREMRVLRESVLGVLFCNDSGCFKVTEEKGGRWPVFLVTREGLNSQEVEV